VNGDVITEADVASHVSELLDAQPPEAASKLDPADVHQAMLRHLLEQRLILQEAKQLNLTVGPDEIAGRLEKIRKKFDSDEAFAAALAQAHLAKEELKEQIHQQLMVDRLIDAKVRATISVSPQEVAKELERRPEVARTGDRVRASHILVRVSDTRSEEKARALVEDLHRQLTGGANFAQLATRYSEDPHADAGGSMGWVAQGELLPELDQALFSLEPGQLSAPLKTRLGFHLVRVDERRTATSLSLLEANTAVYQELYELKFKEALRRWIGELVRKAYIEIIPLEGR
jgi:parvulin-like peptidyl-prolyl isomerase